MLVLDTNHIREITTQSALGKRLEARLESADTPAVLTVVTAEECMRGWLARIAATKDVADQVMAYRELERLFALIAEYTLLPWDDDAARRFKAYRNRGVRIGSADLKIACIVIEHDGVLLTRNTGDFTHVPGLKFANWLD